MTSAKDTQNVTTNRINQVDNKMEQMSDTQVELKFSDTPPSAECPDGTSADQLSQRPFKSVASSWHAGHCVNFLTRVPHHVSEERFASCGRHWHGSACRSTTRRCEAFVPVKCAVQALTRIALAQDGSLELGGAGIRVISMSMATGTPQLFLSQSCWHSAGTLSS